MSEEMFNIVKLKDTIQIPPIQFDQDLKEALEEHLNLKFANKVIIDVGLCIVLFEITKIGDSNILPGDGASYTTVHFSFVVFRPFIDEVIIGKVRNCSRDGVHITLGFFDDILIPVTSLQQPARFDEKEQLWAWVYTNDDTSEVHDLFMDKDEKIRFRVVEEKFTDTSPSGPGLGEKTNEGAPYTLTASIYESGLGLLSWWS